MESAKYVGKNVEVNEYQRALNSLVKNDYEYYDEETNSHLYDKDLRKSDIKILQELVDKATPKKPLIKYYGEEGNKSIKVCCPNGCGIQLNGLDKEGESRAYTNDYCNKCGQAIDWSEDE